MNDSREFNYDRVLQALAQMQDVQRDMLTVISRGEVNANMKNRMVITLQNAAEELSNLKVK